MTYAIQSDISDRYGDEALYRVADRDRNEVLDAEAIERALVDATAEVDTYLSQRYVVPLDPVPRVVVRLVVDIAFYRLAQSAEALTDEIRQRYDDAIALLLHMAKGVVGLGEGATETADGGEVKGDILAPSNPERLFTRNKMRGLP